MGELAALGVAFFFSFTSIQFTLAGQRVGSGVVNRVRLLLAVGYLSLAHWLATGQAWPLDAELFRWGWLGLSGAVGLVLGDAALFQSFLMIGPRRSMLLMTLAPVIATLMAWLWLGEVLGPAQLAAIAVTISGVAWVVAERRGATVSSFPGDDNRRIYAIGLLLGLTGALGQATGLVLSKQGLAGEFLPLSATVIRMVVATAVIWLLAALQGQAGGTGQALRDRRAALFVLGGSITGPFIGVWLSMIAVQNAEVGIASTLMALPPIMVIPLTHWIFHERITSRSVVGTVVALAGAAMIFLI